MRKRETRGPGRMLPAAAGLLLALVLSGCCMNHEWQPATCTEPETCSKCGETQGEPLGHDWEAATCAAPKTCKVCGATEGSPRDHVWAEATFTSPKTCSLCGATEGGVKSCLNEAGTAFTFTPKEYGQMYESCKKSWNNWEEILRISGTIEKDGEMNFLAYNSDQKLMLLIQFYQDEVLLTDENQTGIDQLIFGSNNGDTQAVLQAVITAVAAANNQITNSEAIEMAKECVANRGSVVRHGIELKVAVSGNSMMGTISPHA